MRFVGLGFLGLLAVLLIWGFAGINKIPTHEESAHAAWAQVLNQYQRRAELVPNLVATVKGAADFEKSTLEAVVQARAKVGSMQLPADLLTNPEAMRAFEANQGALTSALSRLMVVAEQYPNLKATEGFQTLQAQLEGTENRIAVARKDYIEAVRIYNTELKTFPGVVWKSLLYADREPMQQLQVDPAKQEVPTVDFGTSGN
ncbi:LemA family protein [Dongia rigui]|uniref:LemA family protein n=1 Tax=Dongia rigui TaxID=940149 RepID=A0ABU5E5M9_9PROT|nr:LemA family protein [Dongia rigui]MDY0874186.1 LemA family protein [Dongia rigui]